MLKLAYGIKYSLFALNLLFAVTLFAFGDYGAATVSACAAFWIVD